MKQKFYAELSRRLREEGIESSHAGTQNLNVSLHGQPVLCVTPSSEIFILPAGSKNEEVNDLYHRVGATADEVYEYVEAVQSSPLLRASDLKEEFRLAVKGVQLLFAGAAAIQHHVMISADLL